MVAEILSVEHRLNMNEEAKTKFIEEQWCFCPYCEAKTKPKGIRYPSEEQPIIVVICSQCLTVWGIK